VAKNAPEWPAFASQTVFGEVGMKELKLPSATCMFVFWAANVVVDLRFAPPPVQLPHMEFDGVQVSQSMAMVST
jgi:hypothetical protein